MGKSKKVLKYLKYNNSITHRVKKPKGIDWQKAPDINNRLLLLVQHLDLFWIEPEKIICFRSTGAKTRAYARIWGLSRIWQLALDLEPNYIIEVISERFDKLSERDKDKVILHEITHIPKNFSGSLVPHIRRGKRNFHKKVDELVVRYLQYKNIFEK